MQIGRIGREMDLVVGASDSVIVAQGCIDTRNTLGCRVHVDVVNDGSDARRIECRAGRILNRRIGGRERGCHLGLSGIQYEVVRVKRIGVDASNRRYGRNNAVSIIDMEIINARLETGNASRS